MLFSVHLRVNDKDVPVEASILVRNIGRTSLKVQILETLPASLLLFQSELQSMIQVVGDIGSHSQTFLSIRRSRVLSAYERSG